MALKVTLIGFENEHVAGWTIPDDYYPPSLKIPMPPKLSACMQADPAAILEIAVMEFEHTGPLPGTYRRVR